MLKVQLIITTRQQKNAARATFLIDLITRHNGLRFFQIRIKHP